MEFKGIFISSLLIAFIVLAMMGFVVQTQSNYSTTEKVINNPKVAYINQLEQNTSNIFNQTNSSQNALYSTTPGVDTGGLMLTTIVGAGQILSGTIVLIYDLVVKQTAVVLGIPPFLMALLEAMALGGVLLAIWSLIRLGR